MASIYVYLYNAKKVPSVTWLYSSDHVIMHERLGHIPAAVFISPHPFFTMLTKAASKDSL